MVQHVECIEPYPICEYDVVVAGGGTGGVIAALAAARNGAKTALIEIKGYLGGIVVEGGTALHSFYNLWKAFPGVEKRHIVRGIPQELIDRLAAEGGTSGHLEMAEGYDYDSVCTAIDTEIYKRVAHEMLVEAGVDVKLNTMVVGADTTQDESGCRVTGIVAESRAGRELYAARAFVDATGYGDLCAHAGADYTEPNDYPVVNSVGMGNVSLEGYLQFMTDHDALVQIARGPRNGQPDQIVRIQANESKFPQAFRERARAIGMSSVITTVHDNYFMFVKINYKMDKSPTDRDAVAEAELELRERQAKGVELFREFVPGCEHAFIARTSPTLSIRRGRQIICDYDITAEDVVEGRHFDDDVLCYGFHDFAPRIQIKEGRSYGIPYRALRVQGVENLLATGMMITSDHEAHMSTRNTVSCMGQGQAAGTAAALCAKQNCGTRKLAYAELRAALEKDGVYFE